MGRRRVISSFRWFQLAFATRRGRGVEGRHPVPWPHSSVLAISYLKSALWILISFSADPDPGQCFGSLFIDSGSGSSILGWIPIRVRIQSWSRALITKKFKKIYSWKKVTIILIKNCNLPNPTSSKRTSKLQEKPSAFKRETSSTSEQSIQWPMLPDPHSQYGSGSRTANSMWIRIHHTACNIYKLWEMLQVISMPS